MSGTFWSPEELRRDRLHDDMCPRCQSREVDGDFPAMGQDSAMQRMRCLGCGLIWNNIYEFKAVFLGKESGYYGNDQTGVYVEVAEPEFQNCSA